MKFTFLTSLLSALFISVFSSSYVMAETLMHGVMCGGEIRAADQAVVDQFMTDNPGVSVTMEAVPWGTCQDKVINLDTILKDTLRTALFDNTEYYTNLCNIILGKITKYDKCLQSSKKQKGFENNYFYRS